MPDNPNARAKALRDAARELYDKANRAKTEDEKAQGVLWELLQYFEAHPDRMPAEHQRIASLENTKRAVADYIAGMTDGYALDTFTSLFIPAAWSHL